MPSSSPSPILLEVRNVSKFILESKVLSSFSVSLQSGTRLAIAGETGSGKTTLLKIIGGLVQPDEGEVLLNGERVLGPLEKLIPGHPQIAYLSQFFELRNNYWVREILEYANELSAEAAQRIYKICQIDHLVNRRTDQLSGGERQRIALARLLSTSPSLLLLDEPYSHLDRLHKETIKEVISDIGKELNISCILVSHEPADLLSWADQILIMKDGLLLQSGTPETVYRNPADEYCARLFGNVMLDKEVATLSQDTAGRGIQKRFWRPDDLKLMKVAAAAANGSIANKRFMGTHYSYEVKVNGSVFWVNSMDGGFQVSDTVLLKTH